MCVCHMFNKVLTYLLTYLNDPTIVVSSKRIMQYTALVHFRTLVTLRRVRVRVRVGLELRLGLLRVRIRIRIRLGLDLGLGLG